jgi:ABC-type multidrug transport system permease subunit
MLDAFLAALGKDIRLLVRDRVGMVFLTLAPIVVITVAGLSLANLYGAGPAFVLPLLDEDGGAAGRGIAERLARETRVRVEPVATRDAARARVRAKQAPAALVVPAGTSAALAAGGDARLLVYTDPVRTIQLGAVRLLVQELRHGLEETSRAEAARALERARAEAAAARERLEDAGRELRARLDETRTRLEATHAEAVRRTADARQEAERTLARVGAARTRLAEEQGALRAFLADLATRRRAFADWLAAVRERAGRLADNIPPPPEPPAVPPDLAALAEGDGAALATLLPDDLRLPALPAPPSLPPLPDLTLPTPPEPPAASLPGALAIEETSVTAPGPANTFDQNVPGFSVTFLLLGVLLGVSLALLDERDWGTLDRLRTTPTPLAVPLLAKLTARVLVGLGQMALLFTVGRLAFGISLGPEPWALALPTAGIVLAGTAFGLVVAALTRSREAVLPVGSIVILTMAAAGGCWWPIDLEPHWMQTAALAFPTTWAMDAYNDLMIRRQPAAAVVGATLVLVAYAGLYLGVGLALFRRRALR